MSSLPGDQDGRMSEKREESERLAAARKIALESLDEDHRALELDAKLAFGPSAVGGR